MLQIGPKIVKQFKETIAIKRLIKLDKPMKYIMQLKNIVILGMFSMMMNACTTNSTDKYYY